MGAWAARQAPPWGETVPAELFSDYTLRVVALGSATLGVVGGVLGSFAVLRRQSLLGDAISHACLPGIALAFILTGSKVSLVLLAGAAFAGWVATLFVTAVVRASRIKHDAALGLVLSVFFGFGLMLLTFIQNTPEAAQAGLDKFLFGQAASLLAEDVRAMAIVGAAALLLVALLWKELKLVAFDPDFGASLGLPMRALEALLTTLLVVAIVLGLQAVGVVLMSAMVVAPAAAARQWTDRLSVMVPLSAAFGALSGVSGAVLSSSTARLPTGPTIVLCMGVLVLVSLTGAPRRGLVAASIRRRRDRRRLQLGAVLGDLHALSLQHGDFAHAHSVRVIEAMGGERGVAGPALAELERRGWAHRSGDDEWALTERGRAEAERSSEGAR